MHPRGITRRAALRWTAGTLTATTMAATAAGGQGRYIIGTTSNAGSRAAAQRARAVGRVLDFGPIGQAVAGVFAERAIEALQQHADVRYVEVDGTVRAIHHRDGHDKGPGGGDGGGGDGGDPSQTLPWGIDRIDADVAHANGATGAGADIAILDTGIDSDHPDLQANLGAGKAFVPARGRYAQPWDDDNEHGTHCAGIAAGVDNSQGVVGVSTEATLHAVKVLSKSGSGSWSDVAAGLQYTADQGWDVASLSLGASSGSQTIRDACTYAFQNGVLVVAAAGNDSGGPVGYPAVYPEVVAVSATTSNDGFASFSSKGPEVDIAAPGAAIYSTVPGGYDTFSGTSMACPHVSGAAGLLVANGYTNAEARDRLFATAEDLGLASDEQGNGLLDAEAALA